MTTTGRPTREVTLADNTIGQEEIDAVTEVLHSRWLSAGPVTRAFEREFAAAAGTPDAVAVSSGTAALHLAVLALDLAPGDEVVVPALSFVASAAMVTLAGAVPVFADIRGEHDLTTGPEQVRRLLGERTRAVVAMHYGGYPAAVEAITALARPRGIAVIEDVAHAPLVRYRDRALGTHGDIGCFSFFATKNITTGEGGMVLARDGAVLDRIRGMRAHCLSRSTQQRHESALSGYDVPAIGLNYRPTEISSALGRVQLRRLADDRARRRDLVARYRRLLAAIPGIVVPWAGWPVDADAAHHLMAVLLPPGTQRDEVQRLLHGRGVQTSVHYPPTHLFKYYRTEPARDAARTRERLPVLDAVAPRLLSLPLHSRMDDDDVDTVVRELAQVLPRAGGREAGT